MAEVTTYPPGAFCWIEVDKARRLGGRVLYGPMDIPKVGRFAIIADPQGADFAVFQTAGPDR